jgi:hypothetical protein
MANGNCLWGRVDIWCDWSVRERVRGASAAWLSQLRIRAPWEYGRLQDGRPSVIIGAVRASMAFNHVQGENAEHFRGDCGVVCCVDVLDQFGVYSSEADLVRHALACGELHIELGCPDESGWTYPGEQARILCDYGVPAHPDQARSIEWLAGAVELGHGVIIGVNAGMLWANPRNLGAGEANHAVTVTGIARDIADGALLGFFVNDSGTGKSAQFLGCQLMTTAFLRAGGYCVITDHSYSRTAGVAGRHHDAPDVARLPGSVSR